MKKIYLIATAFLLALTGCKNSSGNNEDGHGGKTSKSQSEGEEFIKDGDIPIDSLANFQEWQDNIQNFSEELQKENEDEPENNSVMDSKYTIIISNLLYSDK